MTTKPHPLEPLPDAFDLEATITRAITDAGNVPFIGPKQRRAAAAVIEALKANQLEALLAISEAKISYGIRRFGTSAPLPSHWSREEAEDYVAGVRARDLQCGAVDIVSHRAMHRTATEWVETTEGALS